MSGFEEILKNDYLHQPTRMIGAMKYYSLGETTIEALQEAKLISSKAQKFKSKRPDAIITDETGKVIAYVENKDPDKFKTQALISSAIKQGLPAARSIGSSIYIATDTFKTVWVNVQSGNIILDEDGTPLAAVFAPLDSEQETEKLLDRILESISKENDTLIPISVIDPSDLARSIHQKLWIAKLTDPETSLYTFVEIFIFKYLSDLGILQGDRSFESLLTKYKNNSEEYVLAYYLGQQGPREYIKTLFPAGNDLTTVINGDVFHAEMGPDGKYIVNGDGATFHSVLSEFARYEKEHGKFLDINRDFKSKLFESFLKDERDKKKLGQFFTPLKVVRQIVRMAQIHAGMSICDPACGVGKFLLEAISDKQETFYSFGNDGKLQKNITLVGYDKISDNESDRTIILAKANMLIYLSRYIRDRHDNSSLNEISNLMNSTFHIWRDALGTLGHPENDQYDLILTNPPYVVSGSAEIKRQAVATGHYTCNGYGLEGLFCEWIIRALKPTGTAYIVVPDGILQNIMNEKLRAFMLEKTFLRAIISLPINTFFGTPKKTYILIVEKKQPNDGAQVSPVLNYLCSSIGETLDVNRFELEDNDLQNAATQFIRYRADDWSESFEPQTRDSDGVIVADARCKLTPISFFKDKQNLHSGWDTDGCWSDEEKIALGIKKPTDIISLQEFEEMIDLVTSMLSQYKEDMQCLM